MSNVKQITERDVLTALQFDESYVPNEFNPIYIWDYEMPGFVAWINKLIQDAYKKGSEELQAQDSKDTLTPSLYKEAKGFLVGGGVGQMQTYCFVCQQAIVDSEVRMILDPDNPFTYRSMRHATCERTK